MNSFCGCLWRLFPRYFQMTPHKRGITNESVESSRNSSTKAKRKDDEDSFSLESSLSAVPRLEGTGLTNNYNKSKQPAPRYDDELSDEEESESEKEDSVDSVTSGAMLRSLSFEEEETDVFGDSAENFDEIYDNAEEHDVGDVKQKHGSVLMHLLGQVSIGMDLTRVTLPTFILERRSLLEMYADFFAHPDALVAISSCDDPQQRFVKLVKYYLNAFYAARKSGVAKKPYNPILGETFRCRYTVPGIKHKGKSTKSGPFPGSDLNQLTFIAEQVSHHPPISAFYAEHPGANISFCADIYTKSSFLGLSIGVTNIGSGTVTLHDHDETYTVTFPSGYGRSILSTPWVELGGKVKVVCRKQGRETFHADVDFLTKPFLHGKPHRIHGSLYKTGSKKAFMTVKGEWNGVMTSKVGSSGADVKFIDVNADKDVRKECEPVMQQKPRESRRLWRHVTAALLHDNVDKASAGKRMIEERQRREAKERKECGDEYKQIHFEKDSEGRWQYKHALGSRKDV